MKFIVWLIQSGYIPINKVYMFFICCIQKPIEFKADSHIVEGFLYFGIIDVANNE